MNEKNKMTRRDFINKAAGFTVVAIASSTVMLNAKTSRSASDQVVLGKSGIKVSRLGMGTGSNNGRVLRELGQKKFTNLIRYGFDQGITFIDTADGYDAMHEMLRPAIKGVDREKIQIQCKIAPGRYVNTFKELDRFRREIRTDYFDSFLIHCVQTADWPEQFARLRDELDEAKEKKIIRSVGCSMHGMLPLQAAANTSWGDIAFCRVNHKGTYMDSVSGKWKDPGDVPAVLREMQKMHKNGKGIIGMKLIGNGDFTDAKVREESIRFVMGLECVDAVVIGFKSPKEIDEAIRNINNA